MVKFVTAKSLATEIRRTTPDLFEPALQAIHQLLSKYGLQAKIMYKNGKPINTYNHKNATDVIAKHLFELKQLSNKIKQYKEQEKPIINKPVNTYVPRRHGESNISLQQLKLDEQLITEISDIIYKYLK